MDSLNDMLIVKNYGRILIKFIGEPNFSLYVILGFILCACIAYLLGSLNFGVIISRYKFKDDVRDHGSGGSGMTNMMRTYGRSAAIFTFVGDFIKAVIAIFIATLLCGDMGGYIAGLFCAVGHSFPIYFKFKGGKGITVTAAMVLCLNPVVFLILITVFIIIVAFTKYISLGSIMCMLIYPVILNRLTADPNAVMMICSVLLTALVVFLHRGNIKRLLEGTESKFSFKKSVKPESKNKK
jgi:acyl-phosphate glycerol 3-phosphate acyltransferase